MENGLKKRRYRINWLAIITWLSGFALGLGFWYLAFIFIRMVFFH